jgi:hypothetical protein
VRVIRPVWTSSRRSSAGSPKRWRSCSQPLVDGFRRPGGQPSLAIEIPGDPLDPAVVDGLGRDGRGLQPVGRRLLGAEVLEIAIAAGAGQHVEQLHMAGRPVMGGQLALQRPREGGDILRGEGKGGTGHHLFLWRALELSMVAGFRRGARSGACR